jgi:hypothetical protein
MRSVNDDPWRWKLRLFVSTDLVGSTAYKAAQQDKSRWAPTFKEFFRGFPAALEAAYDQLTSRLERPSSRLQTWKFSGDEILFWVELRSHQEALGHIDAVKRAVSSFPELWKEKGVPLRLKATAWLAGFPVTNTEIQIPSDGGNNSLLDFIGPSIDLGFRIARFCDGRRFAVSADLALMLMDAVDKSEVDRKHFQVHLHGCEVLKGVIANEPYPVFWIDMLDGAAVLEEKLLGIRRDFRADDVKDYLRDFIDKTGSLRRPFIEGDADPRYGTPDQELATIREEMKAEESNRHYLNDGEEDRPPTEEAKDIRPPEESLRSDDFLPGVH